jgi:hypothetical protein
MPITSDIHWEVKLFSVKVNGDTTSRTVSRVMFDTGSSLTYIHLKEYNAFLGEIYKVTTCQKDVSRDLIMCKCNDTVGAKNEKFPTLSF